MALWVLISGQQGMNKAVQVRKSQPQYKGHSSDDTETWATKCQTPTESVTCMTNRKPEVLYLP